MLLHLTLFLAISYVLAAQCPEGTYPSNQFCCELCPSGTYVESSCTRNMTRPVCKPCPANTFTKDSNHLPKCRPCTKCIPSQVEGRPCTSTEDRVCVCRPGQFLNTGTLYCTNCSTCPVGQGVATNCTENEDTKCAPCRTGTFSDQDDTEGCTICSTCGSREYIVQPCSAGNDTVCGLRNLSSTAQPPAVSSHISIETTQFSTASSGTQPAPGASPWAIALPSAIVLLVLIGLVCISIYKRVCCQRGASESIVFDQVSVSDDAPKREVFRAVESAAVPSRSSSHGLRGRRPHRSARGNGREMPAGSPTDPLGDKGKMLVRDLPGDVINELAFCLNPKGANDWCQLAGRLGFTQMAINNFKLERPQAFQSLMAEWGSEADATVFTLHSTLVDMNRDDAAAVLERYCRVK